jgi:AAA ATPase domain
LIFRLRLGSLKRVSEPLGRAFPAGGPVPPDLVIGRRSEIASLHLRLRERLSTLVRGGRRIGKTTLCDAVCFKAESEDGTLVVKVEVPERKDGLSLDLLRAVILACEQAGQSGERRRLLRAARPLLEALLREHGLPLDLRELGAEPHPATVRQAISLPLMLAQATDRPTVFYLDELQRVADYADGAVFVSDLVDVYTNNASKPHMTVLVNGSDERALELLDSDLRLGKLCKPFPLGPTISSTEWKPGLRHHYRLAGLEIEPNALARLIEFGDGRPYPKMLAARNSGLSAREMKSDRVDLAAVEFGINETERQLRDERY